MLWSGGGEILFMGTDMEARYQERLTRYVTAMRNRQPDRVPLRPLAAEATAKYAGFTCQEVTHDFIAKHSRR